MSLVQRVLHRRQEFHCQGLQAAVLSQMYLMRCAELVSLVLWLFDRNQALADLADDVQSKLNLPMESHCC